MRKGKLFSLLVFLCCCMALLIPGTTTAFDENRLIDDGVFNDKNSMSASEIDAFLNSFQHSCISTGNGFTAKEPTGYSASEGYVYGAYVSAGQVIYSAAQAYDLNPRVLIVTLEKEQSLVSGRGDFWGYCNNGNEHKYAAAMGYGCPDNLTLHKYSSISLYKRFGTTRSKVDQTCVNSKEKAGFTQQTIRAAWLLKFGQQRSLGNVNWAIVRGNWDNSDDPQSCYSGPMTEGNHQVCPSGSVITYDGYRTIDGKKTYMGTGATAGLYWYTPHFHGNELFVEFFEKWFGSVTQSVIFKISGDNTYYLEWGDYYYPVPSTDVLKAYGVASISPRTLNNFPAGKTRGETLDRAAKFGSDDPSDDDYTDVKYVVDGGKKLKSPNNSTLAKHGYSNYKLYDQTLAMLLKTGDPLRPLIRNSKGTIFLMEAGKKRGFPDWTTYATLSGPDYKSSTVPFSQQSVSNVTSSYSNAKISGAPMLLDGKLFSASNSPAIYLFDSGKKHLLSSSDYGAWGGKTDYVFSATLINQVATGSSANILIKSPAGKKYLVNGGQKKLFNSSTLSAWGLDDSKFVAVASGSLKKLDTGLNVSVLIKNRKPGVYFVEAGELHGIPSLTDFYRLGFEWEEIDKLSTAALSLLPRGADLYAPGSLLRTPNGAVHLLDDGYIARGVTSSALFERFGFKWSNVHNVTEKGLSGYSSETLRSLLRDSFTNEFYAVEGGVYHHVNSSAMGASQYNFTAQPHNDIDPKVLDTLIKGKPLTRFVRGSGPTVYYIENGQRRAVTTEAKFYELGGTWAKVVDISNEFMQEIPRGANL